MDLILDVKKYIAKIDEHAWISMYIVDEEFKHYAQSASGINMFINIFLTTIVENNTMLSTVLGLKHSLDDKPASIHVKKSKWYHMGIKHRNNDLPAVIHSDGGKYWYHHGLLHRNGDLPAIIYSDLSQSWYYNT